MCRGARTTRDGVLPRSTPWACWTTSSLTSPLERANGPLVAWVGHVCQTLGLTGRFDAYAEALMEMAREVTGTEDGGLRGFLRVWDRIGSRRSIVASGGEQAVQIMTVHKAKGLAFPVTILVAGTNVAREVKGHLPVVLDPATGLDVPAALLRVSDMKDTRLTRRPRPSWTPPCWTKSTSSTSA